MLVVVRTEISSKMMQEKKANKRVYVKRYNECGT
jgi:hypothetical protein